MPSTERILNGGVAVARLPSERMDAIEAKARSIIERLHTGLRFSMPLLPEEQGDVFGAYEVHVPALLGEVRRLQSFEDRVTDALSVEDLEPAAHLAYLREVVGAVYGVSSEDAPEVQHG